MPARTRRLTAVVRRLKPRAEAGRWLRVLPGERTRELLTPSAHEGAGGRFNPPGSFPVLHFTEDREACRGAIRALLAGPDTGQPYCICALDVKLKRVLDLCEPRAAAELGLTPDELARAEDFSSTQAVGIAAYNRGLQGIIYPQGALCCRNLVVFAEHITSDDVRLVSFDAVGV